MVIPEFAKAESAEHISLLAAMAETIWHEYYASLISFEQITYMVDKFQSVQAISSQIQEGKLDYYFIAEEGIPVGYLAVSEDNGALFLSKLYVLKEHRGKGAASRAMTFLEQLCKIRDLQTIWLTVNRHNDASIAVYEKKGFRKLREQVGDIGNGYVMDDYIMEKAI
ncbi:GNAT family N-acetyltransferase [Paenibacillus sp. CAU 1782]